MTQVIRIVFSMFLTAFIVVSLTGSSNAQIFRRWRQSAPAPAPSQLAPAQRFQLQRAPQQVAPQQTAPRPVYQQRSLVQPSQPNRSGQTLTPYARTTPQQRQQASPAPVANGQTPTSTVRVVTYFDPRTGRSYQRRYIVPPNQIASPPTATNVLATRPTPAAGNQPRQVTSKPVTIPQFNIPPIQPVQTIAVDKVPVRSRELLPILAGPSSVQNAAPPVFTEQPANQIITDPNILQTSGTQVQANGMIETSLNGTSPIKTSPNANNSQNANGEVVYSVLEQGDPTEQSNELELAAPEAPASISPAAPVTESENNQSIEIESPSSEPEPELELSAPSDLDAFFGSTE